MHRLRILLIDDNSEDLELAELAFAEYGAVARLVTRTGAMEALETLRDPSAEVPDVVMIDVAMPVMSGLDLLKIIKGDPLLAHLPVVMLSTSGSPQDVKQAYTLHASSYLVKAHDFSEFLTQIEDFIQYWDRCRLPRDRPGAVA